MVGATLASLIATQVSTIWGYYGPRIGLPVQPFPYVYAPRSGFGFASFGANSFGNNHQHWKLPFAVLVWRLVYGAMLGLLYDPKRPSDAWPAHTCAVPPAGGCALGDDHRPAGPPTRLATTGCSTYRR